MNMNINIKTLIIVIIIEFIALTALVRCTSEQENNMTEPRYIKTNSIGCSQYIFKGDVFWKCPEELKISSVEQTISKSTELQPVFYPKHTK